MAKNDAKQTATPSKTREHLEGWVSFFFAIIIALFLRETAVQAFTIPSGSMEDTLLIGDFIIGEKLTFHFREPRTNEVVIFRHPRINRDLIKRCVAHAGDTIEVRDKDLYVNGIKRELPPAGKHCDTNFYMRRDVFGPYIVPEGHIFVMGDNRDNSEDSRFWGPLPLKNVTARPLFVYFAIDLGPEAQTIQRTIDIYRVLIKRILRIPPAFKLGRMGIIVH